MFLTTCESGSLDPSTYTLWMERRAQKVPFRGRSEKLAWVLS